MKNIAIIPARSGSKGIKDKNIIDLCGKPLMAYTIEAAVQSNRFDCVHVSTDSRHYAQIAAEYGADVPFLRDESLSSDTADTWDALRFVVSKYKEIGKEFETVTLLQPTSPLRNCQDIVNAFEIFEKKKADSVISVCEVECSPDICNVLDESRTMQGFIDINRVGRRQEFEAYYRLNGAIYIQKTELLMNKMDLYGANSHAYLMDKMASVDIDDAYDLVLAKATIDYMKH